MSFNICHCGNSEDRHRFRHKFEKIATVVKTYDKKNKETIFTFDTKNFPLQTKTKCSLENCNADPNRHNTELLKHEYVSQTISFKKINFTVPDDTPCNHKNCDQTLENHMKNEHHHFKTKIIIKNLDKDDVVEITKKDDDEVKIIWN